MRRWGRSLAAVGLLLGSLTLPVGAGAQDLSAVRAQRAELQRRLDSAAQELADIEARAGALSQERDALEQQLATLGSEISAAEDRMADRVRTLFKRGHVDPMMTLITTEEPTEALDRATAVISLARGDRAVSEVATAKRTQAEVLAERLAERQQELDGALARQREVQEALREDLEEAAALERRLEEEARARAEAEARRRAAAEAAERRARQVPSPPVQTQTTSQVTSGRYACPVAQPRSFTDTWGAPRSGGRRHRGTDILAPYGTPVLAVTDGVVALQGYGSSAGNWLILRGGDGTHYWYMHLQRYTVGNGARVPAGTQIATNGDTGNARGTPHVHFEQHPGGGGAINPYPLLRRIC